MSEIRLEGCTPDPLVNYLKSLGIFRIVSQQSERDVRGSWNGGVFVLWTKTLNADRIVDFFLHEYRPTPIVVPWSGTDFFSVNRNGSIGPFPRTPSSHHVIEAFLGCTSARLEHYREVIRLTFSVMDATGCKGKEDLKTLKAVLIENLRARLPDSVVHWIDAASVVIEGDVYFNALLGSGGGNEGNTHFSDNYMQNLWDVLKEFDPQRPPHRKLFDARAALRNALFDEPAVLVPGRTSSIYDAGAIGGPNSSSAGFIGMCLGNPWNFILTLEGAVCMSGAVSRRLGRAWPDAPAFPFMVKMSPGGYATAAERGDGWEVWLPIWTRPATLAEVLVLLREGRANIGRRIARSGVDFSRAIATLGVDRGISSFVRYGIERGRVGGDNYNTSVSLGLWDVCERREVDLLRELDHWLDQVRGRARADDVPPRFRSALRLLDARIFDVCRFGGPSAFADCLCAIGGLERELAKTEGYLTGRERTSNQLPVHPAPRLSASWIDACDDGSLEYRLAIALGSIREAGEGEQRVESLRSNLEPVVWKGANADWASRGRSVVWQGGGLSANLSRILARRLLDASRVGLPGLPLAGTQFASIEDIAAFLYGYCDDERIEELVWGTVLLDHRAHSKHLHRPLETFPLPIPRAYALLKLTFLPDGVPDPRAGYDNIPCRPDPSILHLLGRGDIDGAVEVAARRLRGAGLVPLATSTPLGGLRYLKFDRKVLTKRILASLLFPISRQDALTLRRMVIQPPTDSEVQAAEG